MNMRVEVMSDAFVKYHADDLPFPAVFHKFSAPDHGDPHDHPWAFRTFILKGGYVEEVFDLRTGEALRYHRRPGESVDVPADRIHRITDLPDGECWTLILPQPGEGRKSGFYQFRDGQAWSLA